MLEILRSSGMFLLIVGAISIVSALPYYYLMLSQIDSQDEGILPDWFKALGNESILSPVGRKYRQRCIGLLRLGFYLGLAGLLVNVVVVSDELKIMGSE